MKRYENISEERDRIEEVIRRYGYAPEHHLGWYLCCPDPGEKNVFIESENGALLTIEDTAGECTVLSEPLASEDKRADLLIEYIQHAFSNPDIKKIWFELEAPTRKAFLKALPQEFRANPINYTLTAPLMDLTEFDLGLPGGHYKSVRKEKHKFYRSHLVEVQDAKTYENKKGLHQIIDDWKNKRFAHDRAFYARYHNMIDSNFAGMTEARVFIVDGRPAGINAGWMIPNTHCYYGGVGIHDYSIEDLGRMLYLEDLVWLKIRGYREIDMGGGEKALTEFKNKFIPKSFYKTFVFSVVKNAIMLVTNAQRTESKIS
jgi:hypothetical protein